MGLLATTAYTILIESFTCYCDTELSQSRGNIVVKSHTRAQPKFGILQQYYLETEVIDISDKKQVIYSFSHTPYIAIINTSEKLKLNYPFGNPSFQQVCSRHYKN